MQAFLMIPYRKEIYEIYDQAIKPALHKVGVESILIENEAFHGSVPAEMERLIKESVFCLADVTGANPNVMWESAFAQALDKPVIFISQDPSETLPFNIRHNRCLTYSAEPGGILKLSDEIEKTARSILEGESSDLELLRKTLVPESIAGSKAPFVVSACPLSFSRAYGVKGGWRNREPFTFSDYVGIRGLMRAFGLIFGLHNLPELANPEDFNASVLDRAMNLYCIASPKANPWTGDVMDRFFSKKENRWDFRPDPESRNIMNPKVIMRLDGRKYSPIKWKETKRTEKDFGLVLRGPNPSNKNCLVMILAGRSALGTEAACLAVTDTDCLRKLNKHLKDKRIDIENHNDSFWAIVSIECRKRDDTYVTRTESFHVHCVETCE